MDRKAEEDIAAVSQKLSHSSEVQGHGKEVHDELDKRVNIKEYVSKKAKIVKAAAVREEHRQRPEKAQD